MQFLRDMERLIFCDNRWHHFLACVNGVVGWMVDRVYHAPKGALMLFVGAYFIHGFLMNAVVGQAGAHPAVLVTSSEVQRSENSRGGVSYTSVPDMQAKATHAINDRAPKKQETIDFRAFQSAILDLSRARNFDEMTPEQTAAITRAALALHE